jgi:hypothetical protein
VLAILDMPTGALFQLDRIEHRIRTVSLATHAEMSPPIGPLSLYGDVLTVLCLGEG